MRLEDVVPGMRLIGVTAQPVQVVKAEWLGDDYLRVAYRDTAGVVSESLFDRTLEAQLSVDQPVTAESSADDVRRWKLGVEALRIRHAGLIDPMLAVSTSSLRPLPHQIQAVYGELLPRTPLRYLLADDPGAGKTIMSGLYIKELLLRGDLDRCLIVAPGGLVEQWADELWEKFRLSFRLLTRELIGSTVGVSVFDDNPLLIARMDMLARDEDLQALLERSEWDLVVVDEAHRMSARYVGRDLEATKRYGLGRLLGQVTRNLLLMTATPHSGDPTAFRAFLALLDEDRFAGGAPGSPVPGTDLMRRMLKEELLTMDGRPLFPERRASTVSYRLSALEQDLYEAVSEYVRHEMNRAERLRTAGDGGRAHTVGFALTVLQRRLASSPEAIHRSLQRRRERLARRRDEITSGAREEDGPGAIDGLAAPKRPDIDEPDRDPAELEATEDVLVHGASAATTMAELTDEINALDELVAAAAQVRSSSTDSKWVELRSILEDDAMTRDERGAHRKIIIFTEHRDTLSYLAERIRELPGLADGVTEIHGGVSRSRRREVQQRFTRDPGTTVLVATDAAGEGLNLQAAHLMVNYDLPWNPNRIEQRFGRIHRIGQAEVCHLWNLVAHGTREGDVFLRLLAKMEEQSKAYQGKVFDVLGEAFEATPLRDLLVQAVRYGDDPDVRRQLDTVIDDRVANGIPDLVQKRAMYQDVLQQVDVDEARDRVDVGTRSRLQPHFVASWFEAGLKELGGRGRRRADGHLEVSFIPADVRGVARQPGGARLRQRYDSISFDPDEESPAVGTAPDLVGPGHPLLDALSDAVQQRSRPLMNVGLVLVDDGESSSVRSFFAVIHEVVDGHSEPHMLSRRVALVEVASDGSYVDSGPAYLDYRAARATELSLVARVLDDATISADGLERMAQEWSMSHLVPEHVASVRTTHAVAVDRARTEVQERLGSELAHWRRQDGSSRGPQGRDAGQGAQRRVEEIEKRLTRRLLDLDADARVVPRPPRVLACAVVVPSRLLSEGAPSAGACDQGRRAAAVQRVKEIETSLGHQLHPDPVQGRAGVRATLADGSSRWVEVCFEPSSSRNVTVTRTQLLQARNLGDRYRLALVPERQDDIRYVTDPFRRIKDRDIDEHAFEVPWSMLWRSGEVPS